MPVASLNEMKYISQNIGKRGKMAEKFISDRNLKFLLYEMFDVEQLK